MWGGGSRPRPHGCYLLSIFATNSKVPALHISTLLAFVVCLIKTAPSLAAEKLSSYEWSIKGHLSSNSSLNMYVGFISFWF